jgi:hypothetical protein
MADEMLERPIDQAEEENAMSGGVGAETPLEEGVDEETVPSESDE